MKRTYVNVVTESGAATASFESNESQLSRLRTFYHWVHERSIPSIRLGALIRFDQASVATWVKKRKTAGRIYRRLVIVSKVEAR